MGFLDRLRVPERASSSAPSGGGSLARDARAMRMALIALNAEREQLDPGRAEVDLRGLTADLLEGEVAPPTADVALLVRHGVDAETFYDKELARSWEGLDENQRAARVQQFVDLALMLEDADQDMQVPEPGADAGGRAHQGAAAGVRGRRDLRAHAADRERSVLAGLSRLSAG